jgi:hypothetical protein
MTSSSRNSRKINIKTAFPALIKLVSVKSLLSGDKEGEIRLRFAPADDVMDALQRLHRADKEVMVAIVELSDKSEQNQNEEPTLQKRTKRKPKGETEGVEV